MNILVAHDGSAQADEAFRKAAEIAASTKSPVIVLSVVPDLCMMEISDDDCKKMYEIMTNESAKRLEDLKKEISAQFSDFDMQTEVIFGNAAEIILQVAKDKAVDLVVIGSHGRHGAKKFLLGSVSSKVVDHAHCDVLVVKSGNKA
jgi:nucleotide-binding universal stress UspA family protein